MNLAEELGFRGTRFQFRALGFFQGPRTGRLGTPEVLAPALPSGPCSQCWRTATDPFFLFPPSFLRQEACWGPRLAGASQDLGLMLIYGDTAPLCVLGGIP